MLEAANLKLQKDNKLLLVENNLPHPIENSAIV